MEIKKTINGNAMTLDVSGRLETLTAASLDAEVHAIPPAVIDLTLGFGALEYISSAGLRVVLLAHKALASRGGTMKVAGANETVKRVFDITGFSSILNFA